MELVVVDGPDAGRVFPLGEASVLGRDATAAIRLIDEEVSRRHAILSTSGESVQVEDLGSSNGTFVEGERVEGEAVELKPGDSMRVGKTTLQLRPEGDADDADADEDDLPSTKVPLPELADEPPTGEQR
jgi:pSer/pThr/pTyr-binding forkhead associated (FHA) protein